MVRPIVVGVHPNRDEREPVELAVRLSCMTDAPLELVGTFWFDATPARTAASDFKAKFSRDVQQALQDRIGDSRPCNEVRVFSAPGSAARLLHERAEQSRAGMIVVGSSHGGPVGRITLGSTTDRVLDGAPCPVAVAPRGFTDPGHGPERIGVAFADTPEGRAALRGAAAICRRTGASLSAWTGLHSPSDAAMAQAQTAIDDAVELLAADIVAETRVLAGGIQELIAKTSDLDLLVTGSRGYGPMRSTVLGGVSRKFARQALCPLVVIPRGLDRPLGDLFAARPEALSH